LNSGQSAVSDGRILVRKPKGNADVAEDMGTKDVVILGSTGSVGTNTLAVVRAFRDQLRVLGLSAHSQARELARQVREFEPRVVGLTERSAHRALREELKGVDTKVLEGEEGLAQMARMPEADIVVSAIAGAAGLPAAVHALRAGHTLALANKEALVMAGPLVTKLASEHDAEILPVDSEHSAISQALRCGEPEDVHRIILTASGGPFYGEGYSKLPQATPGEALDHPNWDMGAKITIDSATMMNKGLEVIEARWLFDLTTEKIEVVIHPQSLVHSMVEFADGSIIAQMGAPDMKLPIQHALTHPRHCDGPAERLDLNDLDGLEFRKADPEEFPALQLAYRAARRGGTAGAVLNAADEVAVNAFLDGRIELPQILDCVRHVTSKHTEDSSEQLTLEIIRQADRWAREEARTWLE